MKPSLSLEIMGRSYNTYGGAYTPFDLVGDIFTVDAPDFGPALNQIVLTFHFPIQGVARKSLESLLVQFNANRATLPKVRFRRSRQTASIDVASNLISYDESFRRSAQHPDPVLLKGALQETIAALRLLAPKFTKKDSFDYPAFLQHCVERAATVPDDADELFQYRLDLRRKRSGILAAMDEWEKLGIDFRDYHPTARQLLNDVWFWSDTDDFSPHGNDTGADVLADYGKWLKRNPKGDPLQFYQQLPRQWGFTDENDPDLLRLLDEAAIAIAFAEIKLTGACHPKARDLAIRGIARQRQSTDADTSTSYKAKRLQSLRLIEDALGRAPTRGEVL